MTTITPGALVRLGPQAVIGADAMQWILLKLKRPDLPLDAPLDPKKTRPLAFCRTRAGLLREIAEKGLELSPHGRGIVESLDTTFEPGKPAGTAPQPREPADSGAWMDE